ncbi:nucleotidyltransferase family protein [bacterium]|nr:nucleotidyltransferase family protein [bacterium]
MISNTPLLEFLMDLPEKELRAVAQEHAIGGLLAQFQNVFSEQETQSEFLKNRQLQMQKNILFVDEFNNIQKQFYKKFSQRLTPLKGLSLLKKIYSLGERALTDMDLYTTIPAKDFEIFFRDLGYHLKNESKWYFNKHKWVFSKTSPLIDFTVEVHSQLLPQDIHWKWTINSDGELSPDEEFLYLTAHWAQQHTCLKLFWLFDLYFFAHKQNIIITDGLLQKAKELQIESSLWAAKVALEENFDLSILDKNLKVSHNPLLPYLLQPESLAYLYRDRWRYLLLKHLLKDNLYKSLSYDSLWMKHQIDQKLSKYKNTLSRDL